MIDTHQKQTPWRAIMVSWAVAIIATFATFYPRFVSADFNSGDGWSYLALSDSIFTDFYRVTLIRDFQFHSFYPAWFPPLYPVALALARLVWDQGIYTGFFLNILFYLLIFKSFNTLTRTLKIPYWCGLFSYCSFLCFDYLTLEAERARGMPLAVLVFCLILNSFLKHDGISLKGTLILGLISGLGPLSRFDFLPFVLVLGIILIYFCTERRVTHFFVFYSGLAIMLSPWIVYSMYHFHKPFVSDNTALALIAEPVTEIGYYYPSGDTRDTLFTKPGRWFYYLFTIKFKGVIESIFRILISFFPLQLLIGSSLYHYTTSNQNRIFSDSISRKFTLCWCAVIFGLIPVTIGGYGMFTRYFTIATVFLFLYFLYYLRDWLNEKMFSNRLPMLCAFGLVVCVYQVTTLNYTQMIKNPCSFQQRHIDKNQFHDLCSVLDHSKKDQARIAIVRDGILAQKFSALTKKETISFPNNITDATFDAWATEYKVTHILDKQDFLTSDISRNYIFKKTEVANLYELEERQ